VWTVPLRIGPGDKPLSTGGLAFGGRGRDAPGGLSELAPR